jgi:hypothetical protein
MDDAMIHYGSAIKALGDGRIGGYLVLYGAPGVTDLEGDYFTPDTDYGDAKTTPVYYQHGMDAAVGKRKIGAGDLRPPHFLGIHAAQALPVATICRLTS